MPFGLLFGPATLALSLLTPPGGPVASPMAAATSLRAVADKYRQLSTDHYLALAATQSALLRGGSDLVAQSLRGTAALDFSHAAAMGTIGLLVSGCLGATWLRTIEGKLGEPGCTKPTTVAKKTLADFCLYAPFANSAYLVLVPLLSAVYSMILSSHPAASAMLAGISVLDAVPGFAGEAAASSACAADAGALVAPSAASCDLADVAAGSIAHWEHGGFLGVMQLELIMFAPYNLLSFRLIPSAFRPYTTAAACAAFTVVMSGMC